MLPAPPSPLSRLTLSIVSWVSPLSDVHQMVPSPLSRSYRQCPDSPRLPYCSYEKASSLLITNMSTPIGTMIQYLIVYGVG